MTHGRGGARVKAPALPPWEIPPPRDDGVGIALLLPHTKSALYGCGQKGGYNATDYRLSHDCRRGLDIGAGGTVLAQDYPNRPIKVIVGFPAGSSIDVNIRTFAPALEKVLKVPIVVENRPGAGRAVAWTGVAKAKPDGTRWAASIILRSQASLRPAACPSIRWRPSRSSAT